MGTRGYYCFRFQGRLYVYYSRWDSYPEGLGKTLIETIPIEPKAYQEWLSKNRLEYHRKEKILDEAVLTLPEPGSSPVRYTTPSGATETAFPWQLYVDDKLDWLPAYRQAPDTNLWIEWVYTIDLDRETVEIKSQSIDVTYNLVSVPRNMEWAEMFYQEMDDEECEEGNEGNQGKQPDQEGNEPRIEEQKPDENGKGPETDKDVIPATGRDQLGSTVPLLPEAPSSSSFVVLEPFKLSKVNARALARPSGQQEHRYFIREYIFGRFVQEWSDKLWNYVLQCHDSDFIFREVAFANLSLACGDFSLVADQSPEVLNEERLHVGSPYGSYILPHFGGGYHAPRVLPGSAPDSSRYWFHGVLVVLAAELDHEDGLRAALSTVVGCREESRHTIFDAIVTNIRFFVLVRVEGGDIVRHTEPVELFHAAAPSEPGSPPTTIPFFAATYRSSAALRMNPDGFNVLMNFFEVAARYTLRPLRRLDKALPGEIQNKIVGMLDVDTYAACSEVSYALCDYVHQNFRLSQQPHLTSEPDEDVEFTHHIIKGVSSKTSDLIVFDTVLGRDIEMKMPSIDYRCEPFSWAPVIGRGSRMSMMVDCRVAFPKLEHELPLAQNYREMPEEHESDKPEFDKPESNKTAPNAEQEVPPPQGLDKGAGKGGIRDRRSSV